MINHYSAKKPFSVEALTVISLSFVLVIFSSSTAASDSVATIISNTNVATTLNFTRSKRCIGIQQDCDVNAGSPCCGALICEAGNRGNAKCGVADPPEGQCFSISEVCTSNRHCCSDNCDRKASKCLQSEVPTTTTARSTTSYTSSSTSSSSTSTTTTTAEECVAVPKETCNPQHTPCCNGLDCVARVGLADSFRCLVPSPAEDQCYAVGFRCSKNAHCCSNECDEESLRCAPPLPPAPITESPSLSPSHSPKTTTTTEPLTCVAVPRSFCHPDTDVCCAGMECTPKSSAASHRCTVIDPSDGHCFSGGRMCSNSNQCCSGSCDKSIFKCEPGIGESLSTTSPIKPIPTSQPSPNPTESAPVTTTTSSTTEAVETTTTTTLPPFLGNCVATPRSDCHPTDSPCCPGLTCELTTSGKRHRCVAPDPEPGTCFATGTICGADRQCCSSSCPKETFKCDESSRGALSHTEFLAMVAKYGDYTYCATQHQGDCTCDGMVRYGLNGQFAYALSSGTIPCSDFVFGNPASNVVKECHCGSLIGQTTTPNPTPNPTPSPTPNPTPTPTTPPQAVAPKECTVSDLARMCNCKDTAQIKIFRAGDQTCKCRCVAKPVTDATTKALPDETISTTTRPLTTTTTLPDTSTSTTSTTYVIPETTTTTELSKCSPSPCLNEATCLDWEASQDKLYCVCRNGFFGSRCEFYRTSEGTIVETFASPTLSPTRFADRVITSPPTFSPTTPDQNGVFTCRGNGDAGDMYSTMHVEEKGSCPHRLGVLKQALRSCPWEDLSVKATQAIDGMSCVKIGRNAVQTQSISFGCVVEDNTSPNGAELLNMMLARIHPEHAFGRAGCSSNFLIVDSTVCAGFVAAVNQIINDFAQGTFTCTTNAPTHQPTVSPTVSPTLSPSTSPTVSPTISPTISPTLGPTLSPTVSPTTFPTTSPTAFPTMSPSRFPTHLPTLGPSLSPSKSPTISPSNSPTNFPTNHPTNSPTISPTVTPSTSPTISPTASPTLSPTVTPTVAPTVSPTISPTLSPSTSPTISPTVSPSVSPTVSPTLSPSTTPTISPTLSPTFPYSSFFCKEIERTAPFQSSFVVGVDLQHSPSQLSNLGIMLGQCSVADKEAPIVQGYFDTPDAAQTVDGHGDQLYVSGNCKHSTQIKDSLNTLIFNREKRRFFDDHSNLFFCTETNDLLQVHEYLDCIVSVAILNQAYHSYFIEGRDCSGTSVPSQSPISHAPTGNPTINPTQIPLTDSPSAAPSTSPSTLVTEAAQRTTKATVAKTTATVEILGTTFSPASRPTSIPTPQPISEPTSQPIKATIAVSTSAPSLSARTTLAPTQSPLVPLPDNPSVSFTDCDSSSSLIMFLIDDRPSSHISLSWQASWIRSVLDVLVNAGKVQVAGRYLSGSEAFRFQFPSVGLGAEVESLLLKREPTEGSVDFGYMLPWLKESELIQMKTIVISMDAAFLPIPAKRNRARRTATEQFQLVLYHNSSQGYTDPSNANAIELLMDHSRATLVGLEEPHNTILQQVLCNRNGPPTIDTVTTAVPATSLKTVSTACSKSCPSGYVESQACFSPTSIETVIDSSNDGGVNVSFSPRSSFWLPVTNKTTSLGQYFISKQASGSVPRSVRVSFAVANVDALYLVSASYESRESHARAVPYTIAHKGGNSVVLVDQSKLPEDCRKTLDNHCADEGFQPLGVFSFGDKGRGSVTVTNTEVGSVVTVGKVKISPVPLGTTLQDLAFEKVCSPVVCPSNCGSIALNGGTCRSNGKCLSCDSNKVLVKGECYKKVYCYAKSISTGRSKGQACRCLDPNCHNCIRDASGDVCKRCRNGYFHLNDKCVKSCPTTHASVGVNLFGRKCNLPFTCKSGRMVEEEFGGDSCKCPDKTCHQCSFNAEGDGSVCTRCRSSKFLHNNTCHDSCDHLPQGTVVSYAVGSYGRECRAPFTCENRQDIHGERCKCSKNLGGRNCHTCGFAVGHSVCIKCVNKKYLHQGKCNKKCPQGTIPQGIGTTDLWCAAAAFDPK